MRPPNEKGRRTLPSTTPPQEPDASGEVRREAEVAASAIGRTLGDLASQGDADRLLDELERAGDGLTQADAENAAPTPGSSAPEAVRAAASGAQGVERAAAALSSTVEQTTGATAPGAEELAEAIHEAMTRPATDRLKPHRYLQDAVLRRMTPIQAWDASLFIAVNKLPRTPPLTRFMRGVSTVALHGAGWAGGALLLAARDGGRGRRAAAEMIGALLVTNALVERVIKLFFRRRRPFITMVQALVVGRKPGSWSFPSGHSATSFACASALSSRYRRTRPLLYALASLVGFSRVYLGHHYPLDVLSGATIGELLSRLVVWALRRYRSL